jgi:pimeloyl-ACP methyl ester carboxylesterase
VKFTACGPPPYNTYGPWIGNVTVVVLPPNPATNPPPPCGVELIDPVKSGLLQGPAVTSNEGSILNPNPTMPVGPVQGVSADGVTQVIVAIPTANLGDSVQLNLINDANTPSSSSAQDGGLTTLGGSVSSLSNSVGVTADTTTSIGPTAFAIYVAPTNYARGTQNFPQDNTTVQRGVSLQTTCLSGGGSPSSPINTPVTIARPPVVLVHGLWSTPASWGFFQPTLGTPGTPEPPEAQLWNSLIATSGGAVFDPDYSGCVTVGSTVPTFPAFVNAAASLLGKCGTSQISGNALGLEYNAPIVLSQIFNAISTYASNVNVAAVQADVIAHSMGGNITRTMALTGEPWSFLTNPTYVQGPIEKLITIGTPHLGSPLATQLLPNSSGDPNSCVRNFFAFFGMVALQAASVAGNSVNGGVGDLVGDGQHTASLSLLLQSVQASQATQPFPMAYVGGFTTQSNLANLASPGAASVLQGFCFSNPLAQALSPTGWDTVFGGLANDAIVPLTSQVNAPSVPLTAQTFPGVIHTAALEGAGSLNFAGPSELDPGAIASEVMDLLNEPKTGTDFQP